MRMSSGARLSFAALFALGLEGCESNQTTPPSSLAPSPAPTSTPTPEPTPPPVGTCSLDAMPDCGPQGCCKEDQGPELFSDEVRAAQRAVKEEKPHYFNSNGSLRVDQIKYTEAVAEKITELFGLCARGGDNLNPPRGHSVSGDEVAIKRDNSVSQNIDIILGSTNSPAITGHWTCHPASF